jgi:HEAT repeat protein
LKRSDRIIFVLIAIVAIVTAGNWILSLHKWSSKTEESISPPEDRQELKVVNRVFQTDFSPSVSATTSEEAENKEKNDTQALIAQLEDPDFELSLQAAEKLAEMGSRVVAQLVRELQTASVGLKGQIIFLLGRIKDKEAIPALTAFLNDDNAYLRRNAAEALGKIQDPGCVYALTRTLNDPAYEVRETASWALGEIKDDRGVSGIVERMSVEREESVKTAMVQALAKIKAEVSSGKLVEELNSRTDQLYKNEVVVALGEVGDSRVLAQLLAYRASLGREKPKEQILVFGWEEAVRVTEEAIQKLKGGLS